MHSLLNQIEALAIHQPLLYALLTVGVISAFAVIVGQLMDMLGRALGLDTSRRSHTQDRVSD